MADEPITQLEMQVADEHLINSKTTSTDHLQKIKNPAKASPLEGQESLGGQIIWYDFFDQFQ